jgi:tetratricopeptide (TPR) repeat protein
VVQLLWLVWSHDTLAQNERPGQNSAFVSYSRAKTYRVFNNDLLDRLFGTSRETRAPQIPEKATSVTAGSSRPIDEPEIQPNQSFITAIKHGVGPKRAVALRLAEKGRQLLRSGDSQNAVTYLEKALSLFASPYIYFYLAHAHYQLGQLQYSLNFLEVAESQLQEPAWVAEITNLKARANAERAAAAARPRDMNLASVW